MPRKSAIKFDIGPFFVPTLALVGLFTHGIESPSLGRVAMFVVLGTIAVVAHELGHAITLRRLGIDAIIELGAFGGKTIFDMPTGKQRLSAAARSSIFASGPCVSFALAALALGASKLTALTQGYPAFVYATWMTVNLGWGALNLLPIVPLDGGRVLESWLSEAQRRRGWGLLWSALLGTIATAVLIALRLYGVAGFAAVLAIRAFAEAVQMRYRMRPENDTALVNSLKRAEAALASGDAHTALLVASMLLGNTPPKAILSPAHRLSILSKVALGRIVEAADDSRAASHDLTPADARDIARALADSSDSSAADMP
jgi:Zn-dependent protease